MNDISEDVPPHLMHIVSPELIAKAINKQDIIEPVDSACLGCMAKLEIIRHLESRIGKMTIALNDAIRRPMGVVPDSASDFC